MLPANNSPSDKSTAAAGPAADFPAIPQGAVTRVLSELREGATIETKKQLFELVYSELRRLAAAQMRSQPLDHTLQPTALVHEAYLKLVGGGSGPWKDRTHFLRAAAQAMRSILVDLARARKALKRGGDRARVTFDERRTAWDDGATEVLAVHDALAKLEGIDERKARVVELRFFGGLAFNEIADVLGISVRSVHRAWDHARVWLYREIAP